MIKISTTSYTTGGDFVARATRAGKRFVFMHRRRVDPSASGASAGRPEDAKRENCNTYLKTISTTSQRRLFNRHLERFFRQRRKTKKVPQPFFASGEKDIFQTTGICLRPKRCAAQDRVLPGFSVSLLSPAVRGNGKSILVSTKTFCGLAHRF